MKMTARFVFIMCLFGFVLSCNSTKKGEEKAMYIASETALCQAGVMEKECLKVKYSKDQPDWEFFYDNIEGFNYEKGFEYELIVSEEKVDNPPADASSLKYTLVKEVSKVKVEGDSHNAQNSLDVDGTYVGELSMNSNGTQKVTIILEKDIYTRTTKDAENAPEVVEQGAIKWADGSMIVLEGAKAPEKYFVGENTLIMLDAEGKRIEGENAASYVLKKQ